jgi:DnaK suppressor protein
MVKMNLKKYQELLEKEKSVLKENLEKIAQKSQKKAADWDPTFSVFNPNTQEDLEESADEVEQFSADLPIEKDLENRFRAVEKALTKIKKGNYGICESCQKPISQKKLLANPATQYCTKCAKKMSY